MTRFHLIFILSLFLLSSTINAQIQSGFIIDTTAVLPCFREEIEESLTLRTTLDNMFSELEKDRVPTGLLKDYSVELVDLSKFDGTLTDSTLINAKTFEFILRSIRSSAVGQKPFPTVTSIMADMNSHQTRALIPFGVAAFRYNYIVSNALTSQLISYNESTGKVCDQYRLVPSILPPGLLDPIIEPGEPLEPEPVLPGEPFIPEPILDPEPVLNELEWVNPYAEAYVYAASPSVDVITTPYVTYSFSDDWLFTNLNIVSLEFDSGLGQGYQTISLSGEDYSVYYGGQGGVFETKTRVTLANGTVLQSHNAVCVYPIDALAVPMSEPDTTKTFVSNMTLEGHTPHATASIKYSTTNTSGQIVTPLIIAEGFDPLSLLNNEQNTSYYHNKGANTLNQILSYTPLNNEYDIIYIDWEDSFAPIEANADILIQVIQWVNSQKVGSEQNVILGYSMGGLVARYALCKMEEDNLQHETRAYISYDTPHLGAHIPLGYMYLARDIYNGVYFQQLPSQLIMGGFLFILYERLFKDGFATTMDELLAMPNAPSVKEMLYYYVNNNGVMDNTRHNAWQQTLNSIGFPRGQNGQTMNILAVSNGGQYMDPLPSENLSLTATLFINYGSNMIVQFLNALFADLLGFPNIFNHLDFWCSVFFPRQTTYTLDTRVTPFVSDNQEVYYSKMTIYKHFLWWFDSHEVVYETHKHGQSNGAPLYETLPSSYYVLDHSQNYIRDTINIPFLASNAGAIFGMNSKIPFVPVASSLCSDSYDVDFFINPLSKLSHTPFNTFFIESNPSSHIADMYGVYLWMSRASKFRILNRNANSSSIVTGDTLCVEPNYYAGGAWSSSLPSIASVNTSGRITAPGRGTVDISYSGTDLNGRPYRFSRKFFAGGHPMFHLSYSKLPVPIDNNRTFRYGIHAAYVGDSGEGLTPTRLFWAELDTSPYCVQIDTIIQPTYNWMESSNFSHYTDISWNSQKWVSFRAEYDGYTTGIYTIYCKNPDYSVPGVIDDGGMILPCGVSGEEGGGINVKSVGEEIETLTYIINGESIVFDGRPDDYTVLSRFLENVNFVSQVKEMAPWGDKNFVVIPFQVINNTTSEVFDSCVKLLYQNNNDEE